MLSWQECRPSHPQLSRRGARSTAMRIVPSPLKALLFSAKLGNTKGTILWFAEVMFYCVVLIYLFITDTSTPGSGSTLASGKGL